MENEVLVKALMKQGKGILAADESINTANARLRAVGIPEEEEYRRAYRELLFTTPGIEEYLSGIIFFDETIRQSSKKGVQFSELIRERGILLGIKVDEGLNPYEGGEVTKGLEGLEKRIEEYKRMGATFTKWRAVARVGDGYADPAIKENASRMAEYASLVAQSGMVPIVEPEVLMEGAHSAEDAEGALIETIAIVCDALFKKGVPFEHIIIKTAMAVPGTLSEAKSTPSEVAERTVRALTTSIPSTIGGVVFLSGGQTPEDTFKNFNAIARLEPHPWPITFSFGRALQEPVLEAWRGSDENNPEAQSALLRQIALAVSADAGAYSPFMENGLT